MYVWASTNGFTNGMLVAAHDLANTKPWADTPNNFTDDLSAVGEMTAGQTLSIRFLATYDGPWSRPNYAPGGFMNKYADNYDVVLEIRQELTPPSITQQPVSQVVGLGDTATFSVSATGTPPLRYQWYFTGAAVPGAIGTAFSVTNAGPSAVGAYYVAVSNDLGTNTSRPANLWVNTIRSYAGISVYGPLGSNVLVQYTTNLVLPIQWTPLTNVTVLTEPTVIIDFSSPDQPHRVYQTVPQ